MSKIYLSAEEIKRKIEDLINHVRKEKDKIKGKISAIREEQNVLIFSKDKVDVVSINSCISNN